MYIILCFRKYPLWTAFEDFENLLVFIRIVRCDQEAQTYKNCFQKTVVNGYYIHGLELRPG